MTEQLVVVGGGQAAAQAVQTLRQQNYAGSITMVGDEPFAPYQRPPLSKKYFAASHVMPDSPSWLGVATVVLVLAVTLIRGA